MIHIRTVCPVDVTQQVVESLSSNPGILNLIVLEGVAVDPSGDAVQFDVIHAEANRVLADLRARGVARRGSIVLDDDTAALSDRVVEAEARAPRALGFTPIWELAEARIRSEGRYSPSWFLLLGIASLIAAIGIFTNSQILVVGAMIVGPEYAAIISVAHALQKRDPGRIRAGLRALLFGFGFAIVLSLVFSLVVRGFGWEPRAFSLGLRPVSNLINNPNVFSVVVAILAGVVGVVSLAEARSGTLIGVFISVTTVPAAADIGVSMAFGNWSEARGSFVQLLLNLVILIVVGAVGLRLQSWFWRSMDDRARARPAAQ
jgi:uncharacterized hydrophobic protein (TIGR00271 family)